MEIVILMIPLSLIVSGAFVFLFVWSSKNGQFDDLETPAFRILIEEDNNKKNEKDFEKKVGS